MQNIKQTIIPAFVIIVLIGIAYSNSFFTPMHYDDSVNIIRNEAVHIETLTWESLKGACFAGGEKGRIYHPTLYRPLAMVSFALNYYFHELDVLGYHIVNFVIHISAALFLFLFIRLWLGMVGHKDTLTIALLAAVLWAINPIQMTSVTYVVQRMSSMAGMFFIAAMYFYLRGRLGNPKHFLTACVCAVCAVAAKENAIMVFPAIWLFDLMFFERQDKAKFVKISVCAVLYMVLLVLAMSGPETFSFDTLISGYDKREFTLSERLLTEPRVILFYIMLIIFPTHNLMSLTHNVPVSQSFINPWETSLAIFIILLILAISVRIRKKQPVLAYCIFFFFLNHIIEGTVFPLELVYEHRNYTPTLLFFVPAAMILAYSFKRLKGIPVSAIVTGMLAFSIYNTHFQNEIWKTDIDLWLDTVNKSPDPRSIYNLGGAYYTLKDKEKALKYWTIVKDYNTMFGTNYDKDHIPYGRVMQMARHNAMMLTMLKKGNIRHAWTIKRDISEVAEIRSADG